MRLKNIKGAASVIEASKYIIQNPEHFRGHFQSLFHNSHPIHLEIGMGKGNFIINMAKKYPEINFIGIEMYDSVMIRPVQKLENESLPNLKLIKADATNITEIFSREIDVIYLNFSDPWPKKRHEHRRLTSERFLERYDKIFKGEQVIIQKTDNRKLFEYSLQSLTNHGYQIAELSLDLHADDIPNVQTEYEERFAQNGDVIYMVKVIK